MEITLARHGTTQLRLPPWRWMTPAQTKDWIAAFNESAVALNRIPSATADKARAAAVIVSSTLRRSTLSAQALADSRPILTGAVFAEPDPPHWTWPFPPLPLVVWGVVLRLAWFAGLPTNCESFSLTMARAKRAAEALTALARANGSVFLVGHALMTWLIAKHLTTMGWSGPRRGLLNRHWECTTYRI